MDNDELIAGLRELKTQGLAFGQIVQVYAEDNTPRQQRLIAKARKELESEGALEFDDHAMASGSEDRGDYIMCWAWVADDASTTRYGALFQPEAWIDDKAVAVDPEGEAEWDASEFVHRHWDAYFEELFDLPDEVDYDGSVVDVDDVLKEDPAAPQWIRDWTGPFTIRVREEEE